MAKSNLSNLTAEQRDDLEIRVGRFEKAWFRGEKPSFTDYLPEDTSLRLAVLVELVHVDLELRHKAGENLDCEKYWQHFPELDENPTLAAELPKILQEQLKLRFAADPTRRSGSTSETLLERLRDPRDQAGWTRFVNLYTPLLIHWTKRVGLSSADSADLVQEVFAVLVQTMPEFHYQPERSFRAWLRTVLLNKWREQQRRKKLPLENEHGGSAIDDVPESESSTTFWEVEYQKFLVSRALKLMQEQFQPTTWQACWGIVVEGRSAAEMARELNLSEGAVYVAKSRVLRQLRLELRELWD